MDYSVLISTRPLHLTHFKLNPCTVTVAECTARIRLFEHGRQAELRRVSHAQKSTGAPDHKWSCSGTVSAPFAAARHRVPWWWGIALISNNLSLDAFMCLGFFCLVILIILYYLLSNKHHSTLHGVFLWINNTKYVFNLIVWSRHSVLTEVNKNK